MHRLIRVLGIATLVTTRVALAQGGTVDPQCPGGSVFERGIQDACQKAVDLFHYMAPQLGASFIGGNIVLGEAKSLGGFGHFSLGVRGNVFRGHIPQVDQVTPVITGAASDSYPVEEKPIGLPVVDAALGILPGMDVGRVSILGVDALINLAYIPEVSSGDLTIKRPDGSVRLGFGARVSIVEESQFTPSISVSFLKRDLPSLDLTATPGDDQLAVKGFTFKTNAWRAVIGKSVGPITLVFGGGRDHYDADATIDASVNRLGLVFLLTDFGVGQSLDRQTIFGDLSINFPLVKVVAEVGQVSGGTLTTYNTFGTTRADDAVQFASLGLRLRW